mgnify:CR=1 FL=1
MIDLSGKKVAITGGEGFLGRAVFDMVVKRGAIPINISHSAINLLDLDSTIRFFSSEMPDYCIHCAGYNGGIEFNRMYPADILYSNTIMALNLYHACEYSQIKKLVSIMTSCAYPDTGMEVLEEENFWNGKPNDTIRAHGIAKRTLQAATEAYEKQYGFNSVTVCVTNLYGPYDTFDLVRTKVVGALIRKFTEAHDEYLKNVDIAIKSNVDISLIEKPTVECWGTGSPRREFMYVSDAAEAIVQALEKYDDHTTPLNIGTGNDITIKELVKYIVEALKYDGEIEWNSEKPDGQLKKLLSTARMEKIININPTSIKEGIGKTVEWYIKNKTWADSRK